MSGAPWWGWLILFCVLVLGCTWVATAAIVSRSMRDSAEADIADDELNLGPRRNARDLL